MGLFSSSAPKIRPTPAERQLAESGAKKFNDHQDNFVPLENSFISSLKATGGETVAQRGVGTADVAQATKGTDQKLVAAAKGQAGQGKSVIARSKLSDAVGQGRGQAAAGADKSIRDREITGLTKMSAFGRGLQDLNSVSLQERASQQTSLAISNINREVAGDQNLSAGIGTAIGTFAGNFDTVQGVKDDIAKKWGEMKSKPSPGQPTGSAQFNAGIGNLSSILG